jgi:hypothetical protein
MFVGLQVNGTSLDKGTSRFASNGRVANQKLIRTHRENLMKAFTTKEFISLAVVVVTASVLGLGVVLAASATGAAGNELLLLTLTLCGAVVSGINGFGRRTVRANSRSRRSRGGPPSSVALTS